MKFASKKPLVGWLVTEYWLATPNWPTIESTVPGVKVCPVASVYVTDGVVPLDVRAKLVTLFWPLRLMLPPAETPRLAMVIALEPDTAPEVLSARLENVLGLMAFEIVMFPLLDPPAAPSRTVPAVKTASSVLFRSRVLALSVPEALRFIILVFVVGLTVTTPEVLTKAVETLVKVSPVIFIAPVFAVIAPPVL